MALSAEEELVLKEWAPLNQLFQKLPAKHQGLFSSDLKLTCIDAISELIVMGTNHGIIYCFNRVTSDMERLKCENVNSAITCIKVISTVDYMLACGNKEGNINIFQIPKAPPETLPASLRPKTKQVERYSVSDLHKGSITALEWSKNGMKLFSGDVSGHIVLTEIDFYMHLCKSAEILDEAYEVVQLNYLQQRLLVSTTYRCIICYRQDKWKVSQVGKKDRKILGHFGGTLMQKGLRPTDIAMYCSRPGLRLWEANIGGEVDKTILFKESINDASEVFVINPAPVNFRTAESQKESSFGIVLQYQDHYLITYNQHKLYVLNVENMKVVGIVAQLRGILDVAVSKDEVFILESHRSLIRIAPNPEMVDATDHHSSSSNSQKLNVLATSLRELGNKIQTSAIVTATPTKTAFPIKSAVVATAEEATEDISAYPMYRKLELYNKISKQDFDDVIQYTPNKKKAKKPKHNVMTSSASSNSSDDREIIKPTIMNISTIGLLPEVKSPDSLRVDINEKENLLAEILNFTNLKVDLNKLSNAECNSIPSAPKCEEQHDDADIPDSDSRPEVDQIEPDEEKNTQPILTSEVVPVCKLLPCDWSINVVNVGDDAQAKKLHQEVDLSDWEVI